MGTELRALISLYDKTNLAELANGLLGVGVEILASGGTSSTLEQAGLAHLKIEELTGFASKLDGRLKTLHPAVHGGILADLSDPGHLADLESLGVEPISLVFVNLYPFDADPSIELIDVGGPAMIRGAAKNYAHVTVVVDPEDYSVVLGELKEKGATSLETRRRLAAKAFALTASYDGAIATWLSPSSLGKEGEVDAVLPDRLEISLAKRLSLKYGENPHQVGALYDDGKSEWSSMELKAGPPLSYLNVFDVEAAWRLVHEISKSPAVAIIKHANPCGVAFNHDIASAYTSAFDCDPISAFGGIVALNREVDEKLARVILERPKADVIVAPSFSSSAIEALSARRKNLRLVVLPPPRSPEIMVRSVGQAILVQGPDQVEGHEDWQVVTTRPLVSGQLEDLDLAWKVCARTSSNAIVIASGSAAIGIGAGQQNRLDSARIALEKAASGASGAVAASDAFFPFADGLETLAKGGITAVVAPSGSIRDKEVARAAEDLGITLFFATRRHFRH